jgi:hypothetical protein
LCHHQFRVGFKLLMFLSQLLWMGRLGACDHGGKNGQKQQFLIEVF